jgi:hypothetical protein
MNAAFASWHDAEDWMHRHPNTTHRSDCAGLLIPTDLDGTLRLVCSKCGSVVSSAREIPAQRGRKMGAPVGGTRVVTSCRRGHSLTKANTYFSTDGRRHCKACRRDRERGRRARRSVERLTHELPQEVTNATPNL